MENHERILALFLVGLAVVASLVIKAGLHRLSIPPLIGFILCGSGLRAFDQRWGLLTEPIEAVFSFLAEFGLFVILFRVGLGSQLRQLLGQLRRATPLWVGNVLVSGLLGFLVAYWLLGWEIVTSLVVATALTATSVGVSVSAWASAGLLNSTNGQLLIDVAELDDLTGVIFLALIIGVLESLATNANVDPSTALWSTVLPTMGWLSCCLLVLAWGCYLFSAKVERRLTGLISDLEPAPAPVLLVLGMGLLLATVSELVGLSIAIGAFLAGLTFSRDPIAIREEASFQEMHEFFAPFFFIGVGLSLDFSASGVIVGVAAALLVAAVAGKVLGVLLPGMGWLEWRSGLIIGVSLVPRAEIAMVIMQRGQHLGPQVVPAEAFSSMVFVSAATCLIGPLLLDRLLKRWPEVARGPARSSSPSSAG